MSTKKRKATLPSATPSNKRKTYKPSKKAVEIEEAGLPKYLSCIIDGKLPKFENPPEKWGNADHIIPADDTVRVLIEAVKKVNPQDYVVIPESFMLNMEMESVDDEEDEKYQNKRIDERIGELLKQYKDKIVEILEQYKDKKRIYVGVNSSKYLNGPSHQNFICVMIETKQIIRFEPSSNSQRLKAFGIEKFCEQFAKLYGYTYVVIEKAFWLNQIHACRLNSLILALNHILDISIETFLDCFDLGLDPPNFLFCNTKTLKKFNFTVQHQLEEFLENTNAPPLPRPKSTRRKPVLSDPPKTKHSIYLRNPLLSRFRSKKKSVVKLKKSKLKKSKKINKQ
jgi:hypothetical protein